MALAEVTSLAVWSPEACVDGDADYTTDAISVTFRKLVSAACYPQFICGYGVTLLTLFIVTIRQRTILNVASALGALLFGLVGVRFSAHC